MKLVDETTEGAPAPKAKVIPFDGITKLDLPADRVLDMATGKLEGVVVVGYDRDGDIYCASSYADGGTVLWLIETLKHRLMHG